MRNEYESNTAMIISILNGFAVCNVCDSSIFNVMPFHDEQRKMENARFSSMLGGKGISLERVVAGQIAIAKGRGIFISMDECREILSQFSDQFFVFISIIYSFVCAFSYSDSEIGEIIASIDIDDVIAGARECSLPYVFCLWIKTKQPEIERQMDTPF